MHLPIILSDNRFDSAGTITSSGAATGYPVSNIYDGRTFSYWKASASGNVWVKAAYGSAKMADCIAVGGHNLYTAGATIKVQVSSDDQSYTDAFPAFTPTSDSPFMLPFPPQSARYWRVYFGGTSVAAMIADVHVGERMEFPQPPDAPFIPFSEGIEVSINRSKGGHVLGTSVRYKPIRIHPSWSHIDRAWFDSVYTTWWNTYASTYKPFWWAWDIDAYPSHVFFVSIDDSARLSVPLSNLAYVDSISLPMEGVRL